MLEKPLQKPLHVAVTTTVLSYIAIVDIVTSQESRHQGIKASRHQGIKTRARKESRSQGVKAARPPAIA